MARTERTTKAVVDDARTHVKELVDAHVSLAKAEMKQTQKELVAAVAPLAIAGVLGLYVLGFFAVTGVKALELVLVEWAAWLVVSLAVTVVIGLLGLVGTRRLKALDAAPKTTQETVQDTVAWARSATGKDS